MKIVPGYDVATHIIEGTPMNPFGTGLVPQPDPVQQHNPFDFPLPGNGNFTGNTADEANRINLANAAGLDSDRADKDQHMIDMAVANNCFDEPEKGGLAYGPKNTGENYG